MENNIVDKAQLGKCEVYARAGSVQRNLQPRRIENFSNVFKRWIRVEGQNLKSVYTTLLTPLGTQGAKSGPANYSLAILKPKNSGNKTETVPSPSTGTTHNNMYATDGVADVAHRKYYFDSTISSILQPPERRRAIGIPLVWRVEYLPSSH